MACIINAIISFASTSAWDAEGDLIECKHARFHRPIICEHFFITSLKLTIHRNFAYTIALRFA